MYVPKSCGCACTTRAAFMRSLPMPQYMWRLDRTASSSRKSMGIAVTPREANLCGMPMWASSANPL